MYVKNNESYKQVKVFDLNVGKVKAQLEVALLGF